MAHTRWFFVMFSVACVLGSPTSVPPTTSPPSSLNLCKATDTFQYFYLIGGIISALASLTVITTYFKLTETREHPSPLIFWQSLMDFFQGVLFIVTFFAQDKICNSCGIWAFLFQFFLMGSLSWYFCVAIDLLAGLRNPFSSPSGRVKQYHMLVWTMSISTASLPLIFDKVEFRQEIQQCWTKRGGQLNWINWIIFFIPFFSYSLFSIAVLIFSWVRLTKGLSDTFSYRKKYLMNLVRYTVAFALYWVVTGVVYASMFLKANDNDENDQHQPAGSVTVKSVFAVCIAGRGLILAIAWSYNQGVKQAFSRWRSGQKPKKKKFDNISGALRKEVLTYSTSGIVLSCNRANQEPMPASLRREHFNAVENFCIQQSDLLGVQDSLAQAPESPQNSSVGVPFTDYAPQVFRYLRHKFGVGNEEYIESLTGVTGAMVERFTEGRSGSFFYFSEDEKFIVKTLTESEARFLLRVLHNYTPYMVSHPNTLISKLLGFHSIKLYSLTLKFIVMQSCFITPRKIHDRYDLKGSWVDRNRKRGEKVYKDSDLNFKVRLDPEIRSQFVQTCQEDANFLASINIMDYSLLLGVHNTEHVITRKGLSHHQSVASTWQSTDTLMMTDEYVGTNEEKSAVSLKPLSRPTSNEELTFVTAFHKEQDGGLNANIIEGPGMFFMGIIDILQEYNKQKKIERLFKVWVRRKDSKGLSVQPADVYAERFIRAMRKMTRINEEDGALDLESQNSSLAHSRDPSDVEWSSHPDDDTILDDAGILSSSMPRSDTSMPGFSRSSNA